ncbi:sn-glycerol-3-phosphate-binding periplasmic protein UgpB [Achromobacter anxifer]|uniref:ABC transporter substrate-binding protein n=1 Tax=Achromobacter anxifer TaxID=1287737 RepID=UPI00155BEDBC|nr:ABC transporter substrate-binding protein [Achromobacter anxifer]CAB5513729.1 sn-glycerol-3-phosphate-binding periplasmic protein UgpB [Achromobacter anxifer]
MQFKPLFGLLAGLALIGNAAQAAKIELIVDYPYPDVFNSVHEEIAKRFTQKFPDYTVKFRAPTPEYEAAAQQALRHAVTRQLADVSFQGLNRQRVFVDRNIAVDLTPFIKAEKDWDKSGYSPALMSLGQVNGKQAGIGFSLSTPIVYYNMDLLERAGVKADALPKTWDDIIAAADKSRAANAGTNGLHYDWEITGNWLWQAMVFSKGGRMLDQSETKVAFDDAIGRESIAQMGRMVEHGTMQNLKYKDATQLFVTGKLAVLSSSTSRLSTIEKQIGGKFKMVTGFFPTYGESARVPAGGNVAMMFTKDPERQKAAWEYIKFATGPEGATLMTKATGYFPANTLPVDDPAQLKGYYDANPNQYTAVRQLPWLTGWYAFPGENGLKITDVINDHLQTVFDKSAKPDAALEAMTRDVQKLLK